MRFAFLLLLLIPITLNLEAQTYVKGSVTVTDEKISPAFTNIVMYRQTDSLATVHEPASTLGATYRYRDFTFHGMWYCIFLPSRYHAKTIESSIVQYNSLNTIKDNDNMLVFGISYRFSAGRKISQQHKKLDNADRDSGL